MVSRKNLGKTAGWITQPQNMIGNWVGQQIGTGIKSGIERIQNKGQNFSVNNYKSNLNLPTYNSRYPGFDEADYKKLEQGAINRGLTGEQKTQFMDEAYQYYYPQVLNKHGLDKRAEEINKIASENGQSILNGDKNVSRNLKLVDLAQTAKRVKGFAYDYPDEQIIEAMKTEIPDGEQLLLNYLNNGDDTILYKAGLKKTDAQIQLDNYNKNKESINKALVGNWRELSDNGIKYLNNYTTLYNIVDEARQEGMGQGMTDNDLLLNLAYLSPEIQQIVNETEKLTLDNEDKAIFGMLDPATSFRQGWNDTKNNIRDFLGWNSETPATLNDIAEEMYVRENRGGQAMKNAKANWRTFGDTLAKFGYRVPRDIENFGLEYELNSNNNLSQEDIDRIRTKIGINKQEVQAFNEATGKDQQSYENQIGLDPIIKNYYDKQGLFESLLNEKGFGYKSLGEATANIDMLAGIGGSIINPVLGLAIMGTDTFARENQDAFETLMNAQTKQGVSYEDAYNNAVKGGIVVGGLNTVIELGLEKFLGGVETSTAKNIKEFATRNLNKEVSEMMAKRGILDMLGKGLETQARSSLEEGMEEVFQQLVSNIAESGYDPDKQISEGLWRAFESGALNPMNLLAGGSELLNGGKLSEADKQTLIEWANSLSISNPIQGTYNPKSIVENIKNGGKNIGRSLNPTTNETITRTIPEKVVEGGMKLTPTERARVEATGITPANFILSEGLAGLDSQDKIIQLANIGAEGYNNVTNTFKEVIPDTEKIESKEAQKMLNIMAKVIENSDILSEEYADYLQTIKKLAEQTEFDPYTALAIKRDFDALAGHDLYNSKGQVMKNVEKETIAGWRAGLNEKLNKLGDKYGVDVRKENQRVMNSITIRDGLLRAMSQNKKNNFLGLGDLGFGALLSSGNPIQAVAMIGLKKFAQNNIGNVAQYLYNLNNNPLSPIDKKGAGFIKKGNNNASNLSLNSIVNNPSSVADSSEIDTSSLEVGDNPLDTIPDRNVGVNPTDVENGGRVLRNEINENGAVKEMTADEEYQEMVNRIMTPKEVEKIVEMAWNANNLRDFYDGEYNTSLEWLRGEGSDQVEMYAENTLATQRMIEAHPELLDGGTTFSEVLDAYLDGTLTGQSEDSIERMDLSQAEAYTPTKFYEPQELKNAEEVWEEANKKVTKSNKNEVYQARGDFVIDAHNPGFVQELGLTDAEVNKKLRDWAAYPAKAKNLSNRINDGVAAPYRWAGLENSSIVKSITVSDADLEKMVKKVEGNSQEYERKYISNAMLALNTHIDWSPLTFEFVRGNELDRVDQQGRTHNVAGDYSEQTNTIRISRAGQNTVAHEMGHYLDYLRGRQLFGVNVTLSEGGGRNLESLTEDQKKFVKHFDSFMTDLKLSGDSYSEYTMTPTEIFARFVGRFTEWTRNTATNDRFGYESKWYNDKFIEKDYIEFAKILQEKSKLDLANEYANYDGYLERNEQWKGKPEIRA